MTGRPSMARKMPSKSCEQSTAHGPKQSLHRLARAAIQQKMNHSMKRARNPDNDVSTRLRLVGLQLAQCLRRSGRAKLHRRNHAAHRRDPLSRGEEHVLRAAQPNALQYITVAG